MISAKIPWRMTRRPCDMHCYVQSSAWRLYGNARCRPRTRRSEMCRQVLRTGSRESRNQKGGTKTKKHQRDGNCSNNGIRCNRMCCMIFICCIYIYTRYGNIWYILVCYKYISSQLMKLLTTSAVWEGLRWIQQKRTSAYVCVLIVKKQRNCNGTNKYSLYLWTSKPMIKWRCFCPRYMGI